MLINYVVTTIYNDEPYVVAVGSTPGEAWELARYNGLRQFSPGHINRLKRTELVEACRALYGTQSPVRVGESPFWVQLH